MDGFAEQHPVDRQGDDIAAGVRAGTGESDLVEDLEDPAAVHVAGKVGYIGRHENRHAHGGLAIVCGRVLVHLVLLVEQPVGERAAHPAQSDDRYPHALGPCRSASNCRINHELRVQCADHLVPLRGPWVHPTCRVSSLKDTSCLSAQASILLLAQAIIWLGDPK